VTTGDIARALSSRIADRVVHGAMDAHPPDQRRCRARPGPRARACARRHRPVCRMLWGSPLGGGRARPARREDAWLLPAAQVCITQRYVKGFSPKTRGPRASAHNAGSMRTRGRHQIARSAFRNTAPCGAGVSPRSWPDPGASVSSRRAAHAPPPGPRALVHRDPWRWPRAGGGPTQARSARRIGRVRPDRVAVRVRRRCY
jgi:hypothetical protein